MKDYKELKDKGVLKLVKTDLGVVIQRSKWDAETGLPVTPELTTVDEAALLAEKASLQAATAERVAEIDLLIADAKKVKK